MVPIFFEKFQIESEKNKSLFDFADFLNVRVPTSCGRTGECHECIVEVIEGFDGLSEKSESEKFLKENYRLACQSIVEDPNKNIRFNVLRRQPKILDKGLKRNFQLDPFTIKKGDSIIYNDSGIIDDFRGHIFGLSIDIGTTTIVMNLVNMQNGTILGTSSFENPQRFGGSDVMNRISYETGIFKGELQSVLISGINFEIGELCKQFNIRRRWIYEIVIVGNSTMRDICFGIDVFSIGQRPYKSFTELEKEKGKRDSTAIHTTAKKMGIRINPNANIYGAPLIGSHVGSDVTADLLTIGIDNEEKNVVLVDVGTNTEIVVGNKTKLMAASCPAGPAFEGGEVTYAMPGYDGAIERFSLEGDQPKMKIIGNSKPEGICGSGLIDILSELKSNGIMNELGVFEKNAQNYVVSKEQEISLSRADVSALAQAKAANSCGQAIVIRKYPADLNSFSKIYLSGGFANYIDVENAKKIGFIVDLPNAEVIKIGNGSLEGATLMLLSRKLRNSIEKLVKTIEHVELETTKDFFNFFVEGCQFKPIQNELMESE